MILIGLSTIYFTTDITLVVGNSMSPTYKNHQLIIKSKWATDVNKILISRRSIIKFRDPEGTMVIKRVMGIPGDEIEFGGPDVMHGERMTVRINGVVIDRHNKNYYTRLQSPGESGKDYLKYVKEKTKYKLKPNQYFVMGDDPFDSIDSRTYGPIDKINIVSVIEK